MAGEVTFQPTEADFVRANRDHYLRAIRRPRAYHALAVLPFVFVGLWIWQGWVYAFAFAGLAAFGLTREIGRAAFFTIPRRAGRLFHEQPSFQHPLTYGWDETGMRTKSVVSDSRVSWSDLLRWSDGDEIFRFYLNERTFYFLPHRVLTDDQIDDLRTLATSHNVPLF